MCQIVPVRGTLSERSIRRRRLVPDALTLARPVLGIGAGLAVAAGDGALGAWLYLAAYLTDVFDGLAARTLRVSSAAGRRLDGWADLISMYAVGAGLVVGAARVGSWFVVVLVPVAAVAGHLFDRRVVTAHTVVGKVIGGATRVAVFALLVYLAGPDDRATLVVVGGGIFAVTYAYEAIVTLADLRSGERPVV